MPDVGGMMWSLPNMIAEGYIAVATDYLGHGTEGIHPYLIGKSEARSVLDSVRAARDLPNSGAANRFAVWGYSQGGYDALFTGEVAARYAPDFKLVGICTTLAVPPHSQMTRGCYRSCCHGRSANCLVSATHLAG